MGVEIISQKAIIFHQSIMLECIKLYIVAFNSIFNIQWAWTKNDIHYEMRCRPMAEFRRALGEFQAGKVSH